MHVHQDPTSRVLQDQADGENPVGCFLVPEVNEDADSAAQEQVVLSSFAAPHSRQTPNLELIRSQCQVEMVLDDCVKYLAFRAHSRMVASLSPQVPQKSSTKLN